MSHEGIVDDKHNQSTDKDGCHITPNNQSPGSDHRATPVDLSPDVTVVHCAHKGIDSTNTTKTIVYWDTPVASSIV